MKHLTILGITGVAQWRDHCLYRLGACLLTVLFIAGCGGVTREIVYRPTIENVPKMSHADARKTFIQLFDKSNIYKPHTFKFYPILFRMMFIF